MVGAKHLILNPLDQNSASVFEVGSMLASKQLLGRCMKVPNVSVKIPFVRPLQTQSTSM